jgi:hypothetical protein
MTLLRITLAPGFFVSYPCELSSPPDMWLSEASGGRFKKVAFTHVFHVCAKSAPQARHQTDWQSPCLWSKLFQDSSAAEA